MTTMRHLPAQHRHLGSRISAVAIVILAGLAPLAFSGATRLLDRLWPVLLWPATAGSACVGALLIERRPANPIGRLLLAAGGLMCAAVGGAAVAASGTPGSLGGATSPEPSAAAIGGIVSAALFVPAVLIALILVPLLFPDGRLISPRWRWPVALAGGAAVGNAITVVLRPGPVDIAGIQNPFGAPQLRPLVGLLAVLTNAAALIAFCCAVAAVWLRFRRGSAIERQQLKWLTAVAAFSALTFSASIVAGSGPLDDAFTTLGILGFGALPIAIGIAVLRYHLYEIDRIISRTIAWAILTVILATVFVVAVVALQAVLANVTQGQGLAVAVSTLVAFALFQPIRIRVQRAVDGRFDRTRYDARRTVDRFAEQIQSEVDLEAIDDDLLGAIDAAVRPASVSIWYRAGIRRSPSNAGSRTSSTSGVQSARA